MSYDSFHPGQVWLDTEGKRIQAHGGSVIFVDHVILFARFDCVSSTLLKHAPPVSRLRYLPLTAFS